MDFSTEELRERKALTDAIVQNLETINDKLKSLPSLEELQAQARRIDLQTIEEYCDDPNTPALDETLETSNEIVGNLKVIEDSEDQA